MTTGKKRISSNCRREIDLLKSHIRDSQGKPFDGDGYPIRQALRELRSVGYVIKRNSALCYWTVTSFPK